MDEDAAWTMLDMLKEVVETGTGQLARIPRHEVAGRTGTSQNGRDVWFIGFTHHYLMAVWVGPDRGAGVDGLTGSGLPSAIWRRAMEPLHADLRAIPFVRITSSDTSCGGGLY